MINATAVHHCVMDLVAFPSTDRVTVALGDTFLSCLATLSTEHLPFVNKNIPTLALNASFIILAGIDTHPHMFSVLEFKITGNWMKEQTASGRLLGIVLDLMYPT